MTDTLLTNASLGLGQHRQESLRHAVGAEEVDGECPFEGATIGEVIVGCHSGVVDEDVERFDASTAA